MTTQLKITPSAEDLEALSRVIQAFPKQFDDAMALRLKVQDLVVTHDEGIQVQGFVWAHDKERDPYAIYIDNEHFVCGCMDNFARRRICKHILAGTLRAYEQRDISYLELLVLLRVT